MASQFSIDLNKFIAKSKKRADVVVQKTSGEITQKVALKTPVDKGRARASWRVGKNNVDTTTEPEDIDVDGQTALRQVMQEARKVINRLINGDTVYISNNLKYIKVLEKGLYPNPPKRGSYVKASRRKGVNRYTQYEVKSVNGYSAQARNGMVQVTLNEFPFIVKEAADEAKKEVP